jgi:hypothetical protein
MQGLVRQIGLIACMIVLVGCAKKPTDHSPTKDDLGNNAVEMETPAPPAREAPK